MKFRFWFVSSHFKNFFAYPRKPSPTGERCRRNLSRKPSPTGERRQSEGLTDEGIILSYYLSQSVRLEIDKATTGLQLKVVKKFPPETKSNKYRTLSKSAV